MAGSQTFHVHGPALVQVGPAGVSGSLQALGYSEDGVEIVVTAYDDPIMTDKGGSAVPAELQDMGLDAVVRMRLPVWDAAVMKWVRTRRAVGQQQEGASPSRGGLIFAAGMGMRVVISSPNNDESWRFFFATPRGPRGGKYGTRATRYDLQFYCLQNELSAKGPGLWLYDHIAA